MIGSLTALHLALVLSGSTGPQAFLPQPFVGSWAIDAGACDDRESTKRLEVQPNRLQYYEWGAEVARLESQGDHFVRFDGEWWDVNDTDDEGRPVVRTKSTGLSLSPDRSALQIAVDGEVTSYVRCPAGSR